MSRKTDIVEEALAAPPERPRPIPDVEVPPMEPDLWGGEGGAGAYPGSPAGKERSKDDPAQE